MYGLCACIWSGVYVYGLCACIWSGVYVYGLCACIWSGVYADEGCVCAYGVIGVYASVLGVLVVLLLLEWTLADPLCCCCRDC